MPNDVTIFSLAATVLYAGVALAAMAACGTAATTGQTRSNRRIWAALAVLFVVLIILRGFGIEEAIRDGLRSLMRSDGSYAERRAVQGIAVSVVLAAVAALGFGWLYRATRTVRGRRNVACMVALAAGAAMTFLVVLRVVSLHAIDQLLYGAFKLNWIGDIGSSLVVLGAAIYYMRLVRARP